MKKVQGRLYAHRHAAPAWVLNALDGIGEWDVASWEADGQSLASLRATRVDDWFTKPEPVITHTWHPVHGWRAAGKNPQIYHATHLFMPKWWLDENPGWAEYRIGRYDLICQLNPDKTRMGRIDWWLNWCETNDILKQGA